MEDARQTLLQTAHGSDTQALLDEQHAALELLDSPPKEAFADIGGAPQAPDLAQADAAQQWQRKALQLLKRMQELVCALAEQGALPALDSKGVSPQETDVSGVRFSQLSGATFWADITSVSSSEKGTHSSAAASARANSTSSHIPIPTAAQNGHAGKRSLIEEIAKSRSSHKQNDEPVHRPGVIIEELGGDEAEHADECGCMDKQDLIKLVLMCALHGHDPALDAPWASQEGSTVSLGILSCLAQALGCTSKESCKGGGNAALAPGPVQDMLLQLLPGILNHLGALIFPAQQQDKNDRFQAYKGPSSYERSKAAQQLAWLLRRLGPRGLGEALGPALPCVQAAATDPSPAVQAQGLWALHHISREALPGDLRAHKKELARMTVKALVACDERAWPAAAAAACGMAVALHGKDIYGEGYQAVMGEMMTQSSSYSHVPARRRVWLRAMLPLLQALGLATVRHFSQLLPLLLEWLAASDAETRLLAAQALRTVLRQTWPRVPAHAQALWDHLAEQHQAAEVSKQICLLPGEKHDSLGTSEQQDCGNHAEDKGQNAKMHSMQLRGKSESNEELAKAIIGSAEILWWAGGDAFREHLQQASSEVSNCLLQKLSCIQTLHSNVDGMQGIATVSNTV